MVRLGATVTTVHFVKVTVRILGLPFGANCLLKIIPLQSKGAKSNQFHLSPITSDFVYKELCALNPTKH